MFNKHVVIYSICKNIAVNMGWYFWGKIFGINELVTYGDSLLFLTYGDTWFMLEAHETGEDLLDPRDTQ